jgi:hypothetical protein
MQRPRSGLRAHPGNCFDYFCVARRKVIQKNWLMMSDAVPETAKRIESTMDPVAFHAAPVFSERYVQALSPDARVIASCQKSNPKAEVEFCDDRSAGNPLLRLLKVFDGIPNRLQGVSLEGWFSILEPVCAVGRFKAGMELIAEAYFHAL